ncbi:jasmonate O-methyltransferase-like protein, partial [Trifolium pratense]
GLVEEEKVDSFNAPYYACCYEELKMVIEKEGSFSVDSLETYEIDWDEGIESEKGEGFARLMRAAYESLLEYHFGSRIMDDLFGRGSMLIVMCSVQQRSTITTYVDGLVLGSVEEGVKEYWSAFDLAFV